MPTQALHGRLIPLPATAQTCDQQQARLIRPKTQVGVAAGQARGRRHLFKDVDRASGTPAGPVVWCRLWPKSKTMGHGRAVRDRGSGPGHHTARSGCDVISSAARFAMRLVNLACTSRSERLWRSGRGIVKKWQDVRAKEPRCREVRRRVHAFVWIPRDLGDW